MALGGINSGFSSGGASAYKTSGTSDTTAQLVALLKEQEAQKQAKAPQGSGKGKQGGGLGKLVGATGGDNKQAAGNLVKTAANVALTIFTPMGWAKAAGSILGGLGKG